MYALLLIPPSTIIQNDIFYNYLNYLKSVTSIIEVFTSVVRF
jgi:hypothetical protein